MIVETIPISQSLSVTAVPLTREAFAGFGEVISNPRPGVKPADAAAVIATDGLPYGAIVANQGSAIQYKQIAKMHNLYDQAPSGVAASSRMTMFVSAARVLEARGGSATAPGDSLGVRVLERHPFTTQTFVPLTADSSKRYLVIVVPSLAPSTRDEGLPVPSGTDEVATLPGRGLPDLSKLRAFIATGEQAVTYGAGTWHAPMAVLGPANTTIDFIVLQSANDQAIEDCQEVVLDSPGTASSRITVRVPNATKLSRL